MVRGRKLFEKLQRRNDERNSNAMQNMATDGWEKKAASNRCLSGDGERQGVMCCCYAAKCHRAELQKVFFSKTCRKFFEKLKKVFQKAVESFLKSFKAVESFLKSCRKFFLYI